MTERAIQPEANTCRSCWFCEYVRERKALLCLRYAEDKEALRICDEFIQRGDANAFIASSFVREQGHD